MSTTGNTFAALESTGFITGFEAGTGSTQSDGNDSTGFETVFETGTSNWKTFAAL